MQANPSLETKNMNRPDTSLLMAIDSHGSISCLTNFSESLQWAQEKGGDPKGARETRPWQSLLIHLHWLCVHKKQALHKVKPPSKPWFILYPIDQEGDKALFSPGERYFTSAVRFYVGEVSDRRNEWLMNRQNALTPACLTSAGAVGI